MAAESRFQTAVAKYLRQKGCFVMVIQPQAGIPSATPDIIALFPGGGYAALEVKPANPYKRDGTAKKGAFQPLQQETVRKLNDMFYARVVWPEIWDDIKAELDSML